MIKFFRTIRQNLLTENKFSKYLVYAIGEITLVVIGILIALQINNANDQRKERINELRYLSNLKKDLGINIQEIDRYIAVRTQCVEAAKIILEHFDGKPVQDAKAFFELGLPIYNWQRFYENNNTFQELTSSGNLALITNDTIKTLLYNIELRYKVNKAEEDHYRFDTEVLIYEPVYQFVDVKSAFESIGLAVSKRASNQSLSPHAFDDFLKNNKIKNGFAITVLEFSTMNEQLAEIKKMSEELMLVIDREIKKG